MENALISNIQRFSTKDGDGIRTTVFFKGCPLRCKWCHNPETHKTDYEIMYNRENCTLCGRCVTACPQGAISIENGEVKTDKSKCDHCAKCTDACYYNAREISGKSLSFDEICDIIRRDTAFYSESGGGVTFSGGECTMFPKLLTALLKYCKSMHIHTAVDTSGFAPWEVFEAILPYTDVFLYDIKAFSSTLHESITLVPNHLILSNLEKLAKAGADINLRLPVIEGCNADLDDIEKTAVFCKDLGIRRVNILPYHDMGKYKYTKLAVPYDGNSMSTPSDEKLESIKEIFKKHSFTHIKIGG
ncbi:MAG: glycyl-radical enzyme activating protein [Clostridia bacterium]|nr:glycyl-radical enzyme activating protein [Clostridia bacterium]